MARYVVRTSVGDVFYSSDCTKEEGDRLVEAMNDMPWPESMSFVIDAEDVTHVFNPAHVSSISVEYGRDE